MDGKRPVIASVHGMVAAAHPLAAAAGARMLADGGNAFDAVVATAAALNVVEPNMSGLAGSGMATCYVAAEQRVRTLAFRAPIPSQVPTGRFHHREELHRGAMAAMAPGNLAGWCALQSALGRKTLADAFAPAIALADDGFPLLEFNVASINKANDELQGEPSYAEWNRVYAGGVGRVRHGQLLRQPDLARTYRTIAKEGPAHVYGGPLGREMVAHLQALGGCLVEADLLAPITQWSEPISAAYRDLLVHTPPPASQSFQYLLALRILDGFSFAGMERNGVEHLDLLWRAIRLSAGARIRHDNPDPAQLAWLLSEPHVETLRARARDGAPITGPTEQWLAPVAGEPVHQQHTTSLSVADRDGNLVCLTQSLGAGFGCGVVIPGTGVCMNNALYWGELDPRSPNALVPGGTLMSAMSPSIALRAGRPVLALGTPGSYGICQTQPQALVQHVDFGLGLQEAVEAPRARLLDGRVVQAEGRIAAATLATLRGRGHDVAPIADWTMTVGGMQAIAVDAASGAMTGAADPRRDGYVATP